MKIFQYIIFIPVFIVYVLWTTPLIYRINRIPYLDYFELVLFLIQTIWVFISATYLSLYLYPNKRKKTPLILISIITILISIGQVTHIYYSIGLHYKTELLANSIILSKILLSIGCLVGGGIAFWLIRRYNYSFS